MSPSQPAPLISVIIPCYNQAQFLGEALASVAAQTCRTERHEILVIDDGSTDATESAARSYATRLPIRYLKQSRQGVSAARNRGLRAAHGTFVVFLDADDRLLPNHFAVSLEAFQLKPQAGFVCGDFRLVGNDESWHVHRCRPTPDYFASLLRCNFVGAMNSAMFHRQKVLEVGGFAERLRSCEDYDLYFRLVRHYEIYCHHQLVAEYRRHDEQQTKQPASMLVCAMSVLRAQRPYVRGHKAYEEAYREGIEKFRTVYGEPLAWRLTTLWRQEGWRATVVALSVLLRFHPGGLLMRLRRKLDTAFQDTLVSRVLRRRDS